MTASSLGQHSSESPPPPYSATSRPSVSLYPHETHDDDDDDDVNNPLLDLNVGISTISIDSKSNNTTTTTTTTSSSLLLSDQAKRERRKEVETKEEEEIKMVHPQEGYRLAQDLRCDRYLECSSLTNQLVPEVFQDIASSAVDLVRSRNRSSFFSW